jgi:hypothetical protein
MTRPRRTRLDDPTTEHTTADQSTESASGLTAGRDTRNRADSEELIRRTSEERDKTPRRYDQPAEADPVMRSRDPRLPPEGGSHE